MKLHAGDALQDSRLQILNMFLQEINALILCRKKKGEHWWKLVFMYKIEV